MSDGIKLSCQNPNHPFKQEWYLYNPSQDEHYLNSQKYCTSCASYLNLLSTMLEAMTNTMPSLYGGATMHTDREQLKSLVDEVFDGR